MARPLRDSLARVEEAPTDPAAIDRAYRVHRARRRARIERQRARRNARVRFWLVLVLMVGLSVYLGLTVWQQIEKLFGL